MVFHVKHSVSRSVKKPLTRDDRLEIQELWTRIEKAFFSVDRSITRPAMAKMISDAGEEVSHRTLAGYAAGQNWPHIRILKAISLATGVSLDQLVFGNSNPARDVETLAAAFDRWVSSMGITTQAFVNPRARAIFTRVMKLPEKDLDFIERFLRSTEADHT